MKIKMKRLFGILLSLVLVLGLMPWMSLTAYAADDETINITNDVYDATSVSTLINSLDGFSKLSSEEIQSWVPPTGSGNERLIYDYEVLDYGEFICVAMFENGNSLGNATIPLGLAQYGEYGSIKYYYAKKTVVAVNSVTLNKTSTTLAVGGTETLTATVAPDNATDKSVTWSSSDTDVATVENGVINAVAAGTATITVTATNGTVDTSDDKRATCVVTVNASSSGGSSDSGSGDSSGNSSSNDSNNNTSNNNSVSDKKTPVIEPEVEEPFDYLEPLRGELKAEIALGGERTVTWDQGTALPYDIMKTLQDNPGVTLIFSYTYQGIDYKVTISGKDAKAYTEIPWYGPLYLYNHYGTLSETAPADTADTAIGTRTYTVIPGDTLSEIATKLNTTVDSLVSLNDIKNRDFILVGQILKY